MHIHVVNRCLRVNAFPFVPQNPKTLNARCDEILACQTTGLMRRLLHVGGGKPMGVSIGVSGGLDSTLALVNTVAVYEKLGWPLSLIDAVTLPSYATSKRTKKNALGLMNTCGVSQTEISIVPIFEQMLEDIGHEYHPVECETCVNMQARIRTLVLMSRGFVIGTGDLSELLVGWCTYNGDHMSMYNVNCTVAKTVIEFIVRRIASRDDVSVILHEMRPFLISVADTPITPELEGDGSEIIHTTEDIIGPYPLIDFYGNQMLRYGRSVRDMLYYAQCAVENPSGRSFPKQYEASELVRWLQSFLRRFPIAQFKRDAVPNGPKHGSVAVSPRGDWRMPSDTSFRIWTEQAQQLLGSFD